MKKIGPFPCNQVLLSVIILILSGWIAHAQTPDSLTVLSATLNPNSVGARTLYTAMPLPGGKTLIGGWQVKFTGNNSTDHTNIVLINANGSVNESFKAGTSMSSFGSWSSSLMSTMALQTDGKILIGGSFDFVNANPGQVIARLNSDGSPDTGFNSPFSGGTAYGIQVQPDDRILVGGGFTTANEKKFYGLCRLNPDGSLDPSFNGFTNGNIKSLALQRDGKIVIRGTFVKVGDQAVTNLARLGPDGTLDPSFPQISITCFGSSATYGGLLAVQPDGKILLGGVFDRINGLAHTNIVRLNADGTIDSNFTAQADLYNCDGVQSFSLQADGKILIGHDSRTLDGYPCRYFGRLNADGSLDPGFSTNLVEDGHCVYSAALQTDGKILACGDFSSLGGVPRERFGRMVNTDPATEGCSFTAGRLVWLRGGTSPEFWRASFESSPDGTNWTYLGAGFRAGDGWALTNVAIHAKTTIRARGFVTGGLKNGSAWFVESQYSLPAPAVIMNDGELGFNADQFGFNLTGETGATVVIEASSTLANWTPIITNVLSANPLHFQDPNSSNSFQRFYRVRTLP